MSDEARQALGLARALRAGGDLPGCCRMLEAALSDQPQGVIYGQMMFTCGVSYREVGDIRAALDTLERFIADMPQYPELEHVALGAAYYNLGLAQRQMKRYSLAIQSYHLALDEFRREGMDSYRVMALHNLAWVLCLCGRSQEATEALEEAKPLCTTEALEWHQVLGEALALYVQGEQTPAMRMCEEILRRGEDGDVPAGVMSHACWLAAKVAIGMERFRDAERLADHAWRYGEQARGENRTFNDAMDLLGELQAARRVTGR